MGKNSTTERPHHTFDFVWGCTKIAPGCANCYAERKSEHYGHDNIWGPNTDRRILSNKYWREPLRWNRTAEAKQEKALVFCGNMCDWLEDHPTMDQERAKLLLLIKETPWLTWLLLTRRIENFAPMIIEQSMDNTLTKLPRNIMLGISAGVQKWYDKLWPTLNDIGKDLNTQTFVSLRPLLEPIDLGSVYNHLGNVVLPDWILVGGENGPKARPMKLEWVTDIIKQAGNVPVFVKHMGSWWLQSNLPPSSRRKDYVPDIVNVQEFPKEK